MAHEIVIGNGAYAVDKVVQERYYDLVNTNQSLRKELAGTKELLAQEDRFYYELRDYAISLQKQLGIDSHAITTRK